MKRKREIYELYGKIAKIRQKHRPRYCK